MNFLWGIFTKVSNKRNTRGKQSLNYNSCTFFLKNIEFELNSLCFNRLVISGENNVF